MIVTTMTSTTQSSEETRNSNGNDNANDINMTCETAVTSNATMTTRDSDESATTQSSATTTTNSTTAAPISPAAASVTTTLSLNGPSSASSSSAAVAAVVHGTAVDEEGGCSNNTKDGKKDSKNNNFHDSAHSLNSFSTSSFSDDTDDDELNNSNKGNCCHEGEDSDVNNTPNTKKKTTKATAGDLRNSRRVGATAATTTRSQQDQNLDDENDRNNTEDQKKKKRKSARAERRRALVGNDSRPSPTSIATISQLEATMQLLATVPVWVFDWKHRRNRWANAAALKLWDSPNIEEYLSRDMTEMSVSMVARGDRVMDRVTRGIITQESWTFYPKGKARTINCVTLGVRMSEDEDWICLFNYALPMATPPPPPATLTPASSRKSSATGSGGSVATSSSQHSRDDHDDEHSHRDQSTLGKDEKNTKNKSSSKEGSPINGEERIITTSMEVNSDNQDVGDRSDTTLPLSSTNELRNEKVDEGDEDTEVDLNDLNGLKEQQVAEDDDSEEEEEDEDHYRDVVTEDTLRGVEIIRHLPIAVCQFDLDGQLMFQNPAAFMPTCGDDTASGDEHNNNLNNSSHCDLNASRILLRTNTHDSCPDIPLSLNSENRNEDFLHRFVDRSVGKKLLEDIKKANEDPSAVSYSNIDGNITLEAELHSRHGPKWSSIQLRRTVDPVTSQPVILFSAQDKSDAVLARQEREARVKKSEFLAIMAHEIRTPLHQVTGFIDLLDQNMAATKLNGGNRARCTCGKCTCATTCGQSLFGERRNSQRRQSMESLISADNTKDNFEEQRGYVKLLKTSAQQLMTVISDVLDYSKLEVGEMKFESIPYEPLSVIKGSMEAVRQSCVEKGLTLTLDDWSKDIPFQLMGDPNRLRQVLLNLLSNAVKFTKEGGIRIHAETFTTTKELIPEDTDGQSPNVDNQLWIKFIVSDTGMGISKENRELVFQKYQQANLSVARHFGGTGLGLSICKLLVKTMGGMIDVESEEGKGSSFYFTLPVKIPQRSDNERGDDDDDNSDDGKEDGEKDSPRTRLRASFSGGSTNATKGETLMNILVAEDNKINQKLVVNMLGRMGHTSSVANDGQEAIEMVCQNTPDGDISKCAYDAILMDVQMPRMDGLEATRRLRTMGYNDLLIVGLTASVKRSDYRELGFDDWLPKPILMKDLKAKLSRLHSGRRGQK